MWIAVLEEAHLAQIVSYIAMNALPTVQKLTDFKPYAITTLDCYFVIEKIFSWYQFFLLFHIFVR